ncbi:transposase [Paenibacillus sp. RC62]
MKSEEIEQLNRAMKETSDKRLYERYLAVRLRLEGHSFLEIGDLLGRIRQTISIYWRSYQEQGLAGLEMSHSPGQPPKLTEEQRHQLAAMLEQQQPADVGFEALYIWTLPLVAKWIKREFGVTMSVRGKQRQVPTYGKHEGAKLFGAIHYETGQVHHREEEKADVEAFIRFLQDLLSAYPIGKMAMILDNSRIHHATGLQPFLKEHPRLQLVFLPPYSPNLNPVEGLWLWLKSDVVNYVFFEKFYKISFTSASL